MPSEIITLQLGQRGNQSLYFIVFSYCVKLLSFFLKHSRLYNPDEHLPINIWDYGYSHGGRLFEEIFHIIDREVIHLCLLNNTLSRKKQFQNPAADNLLK
jgi:hypothetical protein